MKRFLITQCVAGALMALVAGSVSAQVFVIKDIRVEGIQRTEPGTVFSHLPFRVGDEYTPERGSEAIHSLYDSGLFRDVSVGADGDVLVIQVSERPAISSIETNGIKAFDKTGLEKSLRDIGLSEGRIFDSSMLERADQEIRRMYLARGHYGIKVTTTTTPIENNRLRVSINVDEGEVSSIKQIRFVGNRIFDNDELMEQMQLHPHKWSSWYTRRDQYSREKLAADLESIRSYYLNQGYLDFKVDSTQVSVAPNKSDVFITINLTEGRQYRINSMKIEGDVLGLEKDINDLLKYKQGEVYNAEKISTIAGQISGKFSAIGYAFASAVPNPVTNEEKETVDVVYTVDPGRRAYVRNINITGNNVTRDEVIRREVRQYESAWFNSEKVALSRDRIDRLGHFEMVNISHSPVEGTRDQVDLEITVKERPTGSISLGAGYSSDDGMILSAGFSQDNVFGTGNSFGVEINTSKSNRTIATTLTEPYINPEGVSRSWEISDRRVDLDDNDIANVAYETRAAGVSFGVPVTENDTIFLGTRFEQTSVTLRGSRYGAQIGNDNSSPYRYWKYQDDYGKNPNAVLLTLGWSRDSRDNALAPTRGRLVRLSGEASVPALDVRYYKINYQYTHYIPVYKLWTIGLNMELGYGDSYGKKDYPFFKNFYAGGIGSVRGYESSSLGPRDLNGDNLGGTTKAVFSAELLTPLPGADRTLRGLIFLDGGYAWGYEREPGTLNYKKQKINASDLRYSVGVGVAWISPLGPLKFSLAYPIKKKSGDKTERFQFQLGTGF